MIRILKIMFFSLLGLILVGISVLAVFIATFDISHYKPRITRELSSRLSREVQIEQLRLDFTADKGLAIAVKGLSINDDPSFSRDKLLTVDLIYLSTDILALISRQKIVISKVEISGPRVHLVRTKEGRLNVQALFEKTDSASGISGKTTAGSFSVDRPNPAPISKKGKKSVIVIPEMSVETVRVENGSLTFVDDSFTPTFTVPLKQIDFQATNLSIEKPFHFQAKALLWADQQNITADGEIALDLKNAKVNLRQAKLETDISRLQLRTLPFYEVLEEQLALEGEIEGKVSLRDISMQIGSEGLGAFSINGELNGGRLSSGFLKEPLADIHGRFYADESNIAVNELVVSHAQGTLSAQGRWSDYGKSNMLMLDFKIEGMQLGELIPRATMPVLSDNGKPLEVEGGIYAVFDVEGRGAQIPELRETLKGDGSVDIRGGKLVNINLLRFVFDKLSFIPDLPQRVEENLPPRYKNSLRSEETILERVVSTAKIKDQSLAFNVELQAEGFTMTTSGNLNFDQNLSLAADFFIPEDLASSMIASVPELSYLSDAGGRIHIPFKSYQGKLHNIRLYPDVEELAKKVIQNRGKDELKKAIFRALDIENNSAAPPQNAGRPADQGQESPQEPPRPEKILIDGIFDAIFKGKEAP